jgi:hypothetical protein
MSQLDRVVPAGVVAQDDLVNQWDRDFGISLLQRQGSIVGWEYDNYFFAFVHAGSSFFVLKIKPGKTNGCLEGKIFPGVWLFSMAAKISSRSGNSVVVWLPNSKLWTSLIFITLPFDVHH